MKRLPFERRAEHYDERIADIDQEICSLIKQRKDVSGNNPGFPPFEHIAKWSETFGLYEDFLKSLFGSMMNEEHYKPQVEPSEFIKHIAILESVVVGERFYTLTSLRQYANASVIIFSIDWENDPEDALKAHQHIQYELFITEDYDSRMVSGSSGAEHASFKYVISPPLPDDISGLQFRFAQHLSPFTKNETGDAIIFDFKK